MGHPAARRLAASAGRRDAPRQSRLDLIDIAKELLAQRYGAQARGWDVRQVMGSGTSTADLAPLLANTANRAVFARAPRLLDKVLAVAAPARDPRLYKPSTAGTVELDVGIEDATTGLREWQTMAVKAAGEALALRSSPIRLRFCEQAIVNDDVNAFAATVAAVGTAAAQNEAPPASTCLTIRPR